MPQDAIVEPLFFDSLRGMESQAKYSIVGATVLFTVVLIAGVLFWAIWGGSPSVSEFYTVYFRDQSLDGLSEDSRVSMKGIEVGRVRSFHISQDNIERVKVELELSKETPVKVDTRAVIERNLVTGLAHVSLIRSTNESPLLRDVTPAGVPKVIREGRTGVGLIAESIPGVLDGVGELVGRVNTFLSDENYESFTGSIENIEGFTESLKNSKDKLESFIGNLDEISGDAKDATKSIRAVGEGFANSGPELSSGLVELLNELTEGSEELNNHITNLSKSVSGSAEVVATEFSEAVREIGQAAKSLSSTMGQLDNPEELIFEPEKDALGPGEF